MGDLPDYTRQVTIRYEGGFIGLEELAARLGSITPWDLLGNIVLMEDFESELTDWVDGSDSGALAARSSRHKYSGDWSVKLYAPGDGSTAAYLYRYFPYPGTGKYALFARLCWNGDDVANQLRLAIFNGTNEYYAEVEYWLQGTPKTLSVRTTGWAKETVDAAINFEPAQFTWFPVLITFDLDTGYYDKLYFGDQEYDISDIALYYTSNGSDPIGYVQASTGEADAELTTYVDDIIVAKNLP